MRSYKTGPQLLELIYCCINKLNNYRKIIGYIVENFSFVVIEKDGKQEKKEKKERGQTCGITVVDGVQLYYMILIIDSYIVPVC